MSKFKIFLQENTDIEWIDNYINYNNLSSLIPDIIEKKAGTEKEFTKTLDSEWLKYKCFIDEWIENLDEQNINKESILPIIRMNQFIYVNQKTLKRVIYDHDDNSDIKLYPSWQWKIKYRPFYKLFRIIKKISKLHDIGESENENTINNESFTRKSIKYWVKKENIVPLICSIVPNLPIYIFDEDVDDHIDQKISSVYFDNKDIDIYHERLDKTENAKLVRIRYYGEDMDSIFIERKVHHEDWTMKDSSKDRFVLDSQKVMPYLRGDMVIEDHELADEIQDVILEKKLYPKIRTVYNRIAFQLRNSNDVRLSLDLDLCMIKEKTSHFDWLTNENNIMENDIYQFPFAVLEVKLVGDNVDNPPEWIKNIIHSDLVIKQPYFSKYIHGCYMFFSNKTRKIPYWIDNNPEYFKKYIRKDLKISTDPHNSPNNIVRTHQIKNCWTKLTSRLLTRDTNSQRTVSTPDRRISVPIRIEPKTFFANERTYLQWFNSSVLMGSIGLAIQSSVNQVPGILLLLFAMLLLGYSGYIYHRRNYHLKNRIAAGYQDEFGPYVLTGGVMAAYIFSFIYQLPGVG